MVYLLLAILCSSLVSLVMRVAQTKTQSSVGLLAANYMTCALMAAVAADPATLLTPAEGMGITVALGVINGGLYLGGFLLLQWNIRHNGVVLSSAFMKLGVLVPAIMSVLVFGETPSLVQILGFLLAITAIVLVNWQKGQSGGTKGLQLVLLLLAGGMADGMSKVYQELGRGELEKRFLFLTFVVAMLLCLVILLCKREKLGWKELGFGALLGIPNYLSSLFLLKSLGQLQAVVVYPTFSVAVILVVTLAGVALFRERLTRRQLVAGAIICVALALLNL